MYTGAPRIKQIRTWLDLQPNGTMLERWFSSTNRRRAVVQTADFDWLTDCLENC